MENDNKKINVVRLFSDLSVFDSPKDSRTGTTVAFRSGDCVCFELVLLNYGDIADCGNMESVSFDILDIGEVETPLPRAPKILVQKTVSDINKNLTQEQIESGACHCRIVLTSADTTMKEGQKYLKITARDSDGDRTTFASGWINVEPVWDSDIDTSTSEGATVVEQLRELIGKNAASISALQEGVAENASDISDINSTIAGYENLLPTYESRIVAVENKSGKNSTDIAGLKTRATTNESAVSALKNTVAGHTSSISELDDRVDCNLADIGALYLRVENAENSKADWGTTLAGYHISDAYTKTQTDALFTSAASNVDTKIAAAKTELEAAIDAGSTSSANSLLSLVKKNNTLFQTKLDKGVLYCDGGFAKVPQGAFSSLSKATMLIRFARKGAPTSLETLCALGDGGTTQTGFLVRLTTDARFSVLCYFKKADGTGSDGPHVAAYNIAEYLDGKIHAFALCWSGTQTRIFIDGELKGQSAVSAAGMTVQSGTPGISFGARATTNAEYFRGKVSDFAVLNYDASEVDSDGNYTSAYSIADYQNGRAIPPWSVPVVFGNGKSAAVNTTNAACVWDGANWSMTQTSNAATIKSMLYYIPLNIGQKLRIKFSNLTGGVLADGKYGFFQPVRQEADQINVSTTSLDAEFTAQTPITLWRFQFNCEAVSDVADRVATVFENFTVERDGAIVALENYTFKNKIRDTSGNGNTATVSGVLAGDRDESVAQMYEAFAAQYTADNP